MKDFYISAEAYGNSILYRGIENGRRVNKVIPYSPLLYVPTALSTGIFSVDGTQLAPKQFDTIKEAKAFEENMRGVPGGEVYGHIGFAVQYLSETFPEDIEPDLSMIRIVDWDIEVKVGDSFPEPADADQEINAITLKDRMTGKVYSFGTGPANPSKPHVIYKECKTEYELLSVFLRVWETLSPHVVSGWNLKGFDVPYVINRIRKVMGGGNENRLSPFGFIRSDSVKGRFGKDIESYKIYGVQILDGQDVYRKNVLEPRPDYKLDTIGEIEVGRGKVDYSEYGSLHLLWQSDFNKYIEYNIEDVELVGDIDAARNLLNLTMTVAYMAKTNFEAVSSQTQVWDALIYNHLRKKGLIIPPKRGATKDRKFRGALVKEVIPGAYEWSVSYDFSSLYPSIIRQLNVSPETMSKFMSGIGPDDFMRGDIDLPLLKKKNVTLSPSGQTFLKSRQGFIPEILTLLGTRRDKAKTEMLAAEARFEADHDPVDEAISVERDTRQKALKVLSNSGYGALGNQYFRYFNINMAEAITQFGQLAITRVVASVNDFLNEYCSTADKDYVFQGDTDSVYICLKDIVDSYNEPDPRKAAEQLKEFCDGPLTECITRATEELFELTNSYENMLHMKHEVIAEKTIARGKKNYAMNIWFKEGVWYDKPKLKIVGLESIRSTTPPRFRKWLEEGIEICLSGTQEEFFDYIDKRREEFGSLPLDDISIPKSVNGIHKYIQKDGFAKGTPINSRGAIVFNKMLTDNNISYKYEPINEGDKVRSLYLKVPNVTGGNVISYKTVLPEEFGLEKDVDRELMFNKFFMSPMESVSILVGYNTCKVYTFASLMGS